MNISTSGDWGVEILISNIVVSNLASSPLIKMLAEAVPAKIIKNNSGVNVFQVYIVIYL